MTIFQYKYNHNKMKKCRVELHIHLDGSVRLVTLQELAKQKGYNLTANNTIDEIKQEIPVHPTNFQDLYFFISKIGRYLPLLVGDPSAIERIAFELAEDQARDDVIYFETRYSPHFLSNTVKHPYCKDPLPQDHPDALSPRDVIRCVSKGLSAACKKYRIEARQILCMIKKVDPERFCPEIVELAKEFSPKVVGIDIAGDETVGYHPAEVEAFRVARDYGIHRTVHAGESGPANNVRIAIDELHAERIGHGYNVLQDENIYNWAQKLGIHFECCGHSSILTGSVDPCADMKHPIVQFAEDKVSFSINKDDPTITQSTLETEYDLLRKLGFTEVQFMNANLNAAKASFLPPKERDLLIAHILSSISDYPTKKLKKFVTSLAMPKSSYISSKSPVRTKTPDPRTP